MACVRLRISGRVQGVGFRHWAMREARALRLSGWVRNRSDGTVEALVSGDAAAIEAFVSAAWRGPMSAGVTDIARTTAEAPDEPGFRCLPTV